MSSRMRVFSDAVIGLPVRTIWIIRITAARLTSFTRCSGVPTRFSNTDFALRWSPLVS